MSTVWRITIWLVSTDEFRIEKPALLVEMGWIPVSCLSHHHTETLGFCFLQEFFSNLLKSLFFLSTRAGYCKKQEKSHVDDQARYYAFFRPNWTRVDYGDSWTSKRTWKTIPTIRHNEEQCKLAVRQTKIERISLSSPSFVKAFDWFFCSKLISKKK